MFLIVLLVGAYLIGSINPAVLWSRWTNARDPRLYGSGNPGATNVLRVVGKKAALVVLLSDSLKGWLPVYVAKSLGISGSGLGWVLLCVVLGHIFPLFFHYKGGKGVATALGGLAALSPSIALALVALWIGLVVWTRYASLASMVVIGMGAMVTLFDVSMRIYFFPMVLVAGLVIWRHHENIAKLKAGIESKLF